MARLHNKVGHNATTRHVSPTRFASTTRTRYTINLKVATESYVHQNVHPERAHRTKYTPTEHTGKCKPEESTQDKVHLDRTHRGQSTPQQNTQDKVHPDRTHRTTYTPTEHTATKYTPTEHTGQSTSWQGMLHSNNITAENYIANIIRQTLTKCTATRYTDNNVHHTTTGQRTQYDVQSFLACALGLSEASPVIVHSRGNDHLART